MFNFKNIEKGEIQTEKSFIELHSVSSLMAVPCSWERSLKLINTIVYGWSLAQQQSKEGRKS